MRFAFVLLLATLFACDSRVSRTEAMMTGWRPTGGLISPFTDKQANFRLRFPADDLVEGGDGPPNVAAKPLLPGMVQGNTKHIPPGATVNLINLQSHGDSGAKVYTIAIYPLIGDTLSLFDGATYSGGAGTVLNPNWQRYASPHRAKITYGIGGGASESVYCDLKRGIKLAVPLSAVRVDVTNVNPATFGGGLPTPDDDSAFPTVPSYGIDVGISIAPGSHGSNNDGLSLTASKSKLKAAPPVAETVYFPIPPHAKDYFVSVQRSGPAVGGGAFTHQQLSFDGVVVIPQRAFVFAALAASGVPYGPFEIMGGANVIAVTNDGAFDEDVTIVWRLNL